MFVSYKFKINVETTYKKKVIKEKLTCNVLLGVNGIAPGPIENTVGLSRLATKNANYSGIPLGVSVDRIYCI